MRVMELGFCRGCCRDDALNEKDAAKEENAEGDWTMRQYDRLTPEEQARITEIQDVLIERYVEQKEAIESGSNSLAREIELKIKKLRREKEEIVEWATAS